LHCGPLTNNSGRSFKCISTSTFIPILHSGTSHNNVRGQDALSNQEVKKVEDDSIMFRGIHEFTLSQSYR